MLLAACLDLTGISLFDKFVEQPFVKKMYLSKSDDVKQNNVNINPVWWIKDEPKFCSNFAESLKENTRKV